MDIMTATVDELKGFNRINIEDRLHIGGFVIIPKDELHESGYRCMEFLLLDKKLQPLGIVGGCSDVIYVEPFWEKRSTMFGKPVKMDILPCGLLHVWVNGDMFVPWPPVSSFDVEYQDEEAKK